MAQLIGIEVHSFSMEEGLDNIKSDYVEDIRTKTIQILYRFSGYINLDAIKIFYATGKTFNTIQNGVRKDQIQLAKVIFSDGSSIYTSIYDLEKIILLSSDRVN